MTNTYTVKLTVISCEVQKDGNWSIVLSSNPKLQYTTKSIQKVMATVHILSLIEYINMNKIVPQS